MLAQRQYMEKKVYNEKFATANVWQLRIMNLCLFEVNFPLPAMKFGSANPLVYGWVQ